MGKRGRDSNWKGPRAFNSLACRMLYTIFIATCDATRRMKQGQRSKPKVLDSAASSSNSSFGKRGFVRRVAGVQGK